jgi:hypothetical protein
MANRNFLEILDSACTRAAGVACQVNSLESTRHLRASGAELLRAVRCSLDDVIGLLEPEKPQPKPRSTDPEAD